MVADTAGPGQPEHAARWHLTFDDGNHEETYVLRPSDEEILRLRFAAPDAKTTLYFSPTGWERELVEQWLPMEAF